MTSGDFLTADFLGYNLKGLVEVCTQIHCPKCESRLFFIFIAPNGQNLVFVCLHCGFIPSLDDLMHKEGGED
jgi:DNA-directed RNA polymerase subunit RPC12/RpoP